MHGRRWGDAVSVPVMAAGLRACKGIQMRREKVGRQALRGVAGGRPLPREACDLPRSGAEGVFVAYAHSQGDVNQTLIIYLYAINPPDMEV